MPLLTSLLVDFALRHAKDAKDAKSLETIDPYKGTGLVRVETEEWRATSRGETIKKGATVHVLEIRGARLVVRERVDE